MQHRAGRLSGEIQKEVADIITREVKDPRLSFVTVVNVIADADLSSAKIYVSVIDSDNKENVLAALNSAKGFIRRTLAHRLKVRTIPELYFHIDDSISYAIEMSKMIDRQIKEDELAAKKKAAARRITNKGFSLRAI